MDMIRLFIAIPVHKEMAGELHHQARHQSSNSAVTPRWHPLSNFHITLSFLGATHVDQLLPLTLSLQNAVGDYPSFQLELQRITLFPSAEKPRFLVALPHWSPPLQELHRQVSSAVTTQSKTAEHTYLPHITIARLPANVKRWPQWQDISLSGNLHVNMLSLYRSDRANNRQYYRPLSGLRLATSSTAAIELPKEVASFQ